MVAGNDREAVRKVIEEIDSSLPRENPKNHTSLPVAFWHLARDGAENYHTPS